MENWKTMISNDKEIIICAAIWYKDINRKSNNPHHPINIDKGVVLCGFRHGHIISQLNCMLGIRNFEAGEYVEGFLTSKNNFLDRTEARKLHISNGFNSEYGDELFSEDFN